VACGGGGGIGVAANVNDDGISGVAFNAGQ